MHMYLNYSSRFIVEWKKNGVYNGVNRMFLLHVCKGVERAFGHVGDTVTYKKRIWSFR